jgi:RNA polymerase sigma-70 factor, ECF subfamily
MAGTDVVERPFGQGLVHQGFFANLEAIWEVIVRRLEEAVQPADGKRQQPLERLVATEKRLFSTSQEAHQRLLGAFVQATYAGDVGALVAMLADDAVLVTDGGPEGRSVGGLRNLRVPLRGAPRIAAFVVEATRRVSADLEVEEHELNGQPAMVLYREGAPFAAILLGVADGRIHRVFFHADVARLRCLGRRH